MKLKLLATVAMIVIGVGAVGFAVVGPNLGGSSAPQYLTATAATGTVSVQAVATGTVQSTTAYGLSFGADPEIISSASTTTTSSAATATTWVVQTVPVAVGQTVTKGEVLATADPSSANVAVAVAKANLAAAQAQLSVDQGHPSATVLASAQNQIKSASLQLTVSQHNAQNSITTNELNVQKAQTALANAKAALAQAQAGPTADQLTQAQASLSNAQLSLAQAQQKLTAQQATDAQTLQADQTAVTNAQSALASAQATLFLDQNTSPAPSGSQIAQDQAAVNSAQEALTSAQNKYSADSQAATNAEQSASMGVTQAQNNLNAAQATYNTNTTPSATAVQSAQQQVVSAEQGLTAAQQSLAAAKTSQADGLAQAQQTLASAQTSAATSTGPQSAATIARDKASVSSAQQTLATAQTTAAHTTLTAPADGQIVAVNVQPGTIAPTGWAITMQTTALEATASFAETSVVGLKVGQPATVTVTAPNAIVQGTVASIQPVGTSSGSNSVVTYSVTVSLDNAPATILSGMSASVAVTTAEAKNVVTVPAIAVVGSSGNYEVRVLDAAGQLQLTPVQIGLVSTSLAEIQSGLSAGQTVVTGTVTALNSSSSTAGGFGGFGGIGAGAGAGPEFRTRTNTSTSGGSTNSAGGAGQP